MTVKTYVHSGVVLEEEIELTLADLSQACSVHAEWVITLVEEGILDPDGNEVSKWRFNGENLKRARTVRRLQQDLGVNIAGSALVVDLLDEIEQLRQRLALLEK